MRYLLLDCFHLPKQSPNAAEEDEFCAVMRRVGATWWKSYDQWLRAEIEQIEATEM
jgi:hypothetical protein